MSQRHSEYERVPGDLYVTPRWVYEALYSVEPWARQAWDCAPIDADFDFLAQTCLPPESIATNPPFKLAEQFCRRSLELTKPTLGRVAMLLPHAFDTAKGRRDLWLLPFRYKWTLTTRIRWDNLVQKVAGPSSNHAWFVWDWKYIGPPKMGWLPLGD